MDDNYSAVLAELDAELAADAMAVAAGVYATVSLADRLRASVGGPVRVAVRGLDQGVSGTVVDVVDDAVLLAAHAADWVVWLAGIEEVGGLAAGHLPDASKGRSGRSAGRLLRRFAGHRVRLGSHRGEVEAIVRRVGADHLEVGPGATLVPFPALLFVCGPPAGRAPSGL